MPLKTGDDDKTVSDNIAELVKSGKTEEQAAAIAYAKAGRSKKKAYMGSYEQDEVNYITLSATKNKACANCRWFYPNGGCHIVEPSPKPIIATGYCDEWTEEQDVQVEDDEPILEQLIEALTGSEPIMVKSNKGILERLKTAFKTFVNSIEADKPTSFSGFKSIGNHQWVGWWTNNFEDREGDYFPNHAIDSYIARVDAGLVDKPTLRYWHVPVDLGKVKAIARVALDDSPDAPSFVLSVGEYDDTPIARAFEKGLSRGDFKMSHGFYYPEAAYKEGVYHVFNSFEHSVLPPYAAANPFSLFGEMTMPILDDRKRKELVSLIGENDTKQYEQMAETRAKELSAMGIQHKDFNVTDTEARKEIGEVKAVVTDLATSIKSLVESLKAFPPKKDDSKEESDEGDKKSEDAAKIMGKQKKDLEDMQTALTLQMKALGEQQAKLNEAIKEFNSLTPRQASRAKETTVDTSSSSFMAFRQQMEGSTEEKQREKEFHQIMGGLFVPQNGNGG